MVFNADPQEFYKQLDIPYADDPQRARSMEVLYVVLENITVLQPAQRDQLKKIVPFFSNDILRGLSDSLLRENMRALYKKIREL